MAETAPRDAWINSDTYKEALRREHEKLREAMMAGPLGELVRAIAEEEAQDQSPGEAK